MKQAAVGAAVVPVRVVMPRTLTILILALLLVAPPPAANAWHGDAVEPLPTPLPHNMTAARAVTDGADIWLIGAIVEGERSDVIFHSTPAGVVTDTGHRLPTPRSYAAAAYAAGMVYIFGGDDGSGHHLADIVRYDPAAGTVTTLSVALPAAMRGVASAVTDSTIALVGGQLSDGRAVPYIFSFDATTETIGFIGFLPRPLTFTTALSMDRHVYTFGGYDPDYFARWDIHRISPDGTVQRLSAILAEEAYHIAVAEKDGHAFLFGGRAAWSTTSERVQRFSPTTGEVSTENVVLPSPRYSIAAVSHGSGILLLGGSADSGSSVDEVWRYPSAGHPVPVFEAPSPLECRDGGADTMLDASRSYHTSSQPLFFEWRALRAIIASPASSVTNAHFPLGNNSGQLGVSDTALTATETFEVEVVDTVPPLAPGIIQPQPGTIYLDGEPYPGLDSAGTIVVGDIAVQVNATDSCGVAHVKFLPSVGEPLMDSEFPYEFPVDGSGVGAEDVTVEIIVTDLAGLEERDTLEFTLVRQPTG